MFISNAGIIRPATSSRRQRTSIKQLDGRFFLTCFTDIVISYLKFISIKLNLL